MIKKVLTTLISAIRRAVSMGIHNSPPTIIALTFLTASLLGGVLLSLPAATESGIPTPFVDSLFTATSATCITGFVLYDTATYWLEVMKLMSIGYFL